MKTPFPLLLVLTAAVAVGAEQTQSTKPSGSQSDDGDVSVMTFPAPDGTKAAPSEVKPAGTGATAAQPKTQAEPQSALATDQVNSTPTAAPQSAAPKEQDEKKTPAPVAAPPLVPPSVMVHHYKFADKPLEEAMGDLMRDFRYAIVLTTSKKYRVSGEYDGQTIECILKLICSDAGLEFERKENTIYVKDPQGPAFAATSLTDLSKVALVENRDGAKSSTRAGGELLPLPQSTSTSALAANVRTDSTAGQSGVPKVLRTDAKERKSGLAFVSIFQRETNNQLNNLAQRRAALLVERNALILSAP